MSRKRYPLRVARGAHGIRAQDLRTLARKDWWARRWIASLEAMRLGPRFGRGRQYATDGQVTELVLDGPHVEATVVGSREAPYRLTLDFTSAAGEARERIASAIAAEPMLLGRLLTDDLPTEIETFFRAEGLPLFPQAAPLVAPATPTANLTGKAATPTANLTGKAAILAAASKPVYDVKMHCSCPDWARPCKHLVAVMLLLGEEVAQRPSTLLSLRGVDLEDLVGEYDDDRRQTTVDTLMPATTKPALSAPNSSLFTLHSSLSTLRRLGPIPFWRGTARCVDALARIYGRCQPVAADAASGKSVDLRG